MKLSSKRRIIRGISFEPRVMEQVDTFGGQVGLGRSETVNLLLSLAMQRDELLNVVREIRGVKKVTAE